MHAVLTMQHQRPFSGVNEDLCARAKILIAGNHSVIRVVLVTQVSARATSAFSPSAATFIPARDSLDDRSRLVYDEVTVLQSGKLSQPAARCVFELLGRFLVNPVRKLDFVWQVELFQQPCRSNGTGGLQLYIAFSAGS